MKGRRDEGQGELGGEWLGIKKRRQDAGHGGEALPIYF